MGGDAIVVEVDATPTMQQVQGKAKKRLESPRAAAAEKALDPHHPGTVPHVHDDKNKQVEPIVWILDLCATFLLEVMGGCGAVWGASDAANVRTGSNNNTWRFWSAMVAFLCFFRWVNTAVMKKQATHDQETLATLLLQVVGGAGAVWGILEIVGLRVNYPASCMEMQPWGNSSVGGAWAPGYSTCRNTFTECRIITGVFFLWFAYLWWTVRQRQGPGALNIIS